MWSENGRMNHGKTWWASPPAAIISLAIADCEAASIAGNQRTATRSRPPLMYTYMLQTPLLCAPSDYLYTADFQNVRAHGGEQTP